MEKRKSYRSYVWVFFIYFFLSSHNFSWFSFDLQGSVYSLRPAFRPYVFFKSYILSCRICQGLVVTPFTGYIVLIIYVYMRMPKSLTWFSFFISFNLFFVCYSFSWFWGEYSICGCFFPSWIALRACMQRKLYFPFVVYIIRSIL